jgi:hypothetical protein
LYFRFIFTEWLIMIENLFFEGTIKTRKSSSTITLSITRLQSKLEEWRSALPITTSQPSSVTLEKLSELWKQRNRTEITFDELIQSLLQDQHFKAETIAYQPKRSPGSQPFTLDTLLAGLSPLMSGQGTMAGNLPSARNESDGLDGIAQETLLLSSAVFPGIK